MLRRLGLLLAWLLATAVSVLLASAAVSSVRDQAVQTPTPLVAATSNEELPIPSTTLTTLGERPSPDTPLATADPPVSVTPATGPPTTTPAQSSTTTTTAAPPSTTTTTTFLATPTPAITTYELVGGWVRISASPDVVLLEGAGPRPGFDMEVKETGPDVVQVKFEGESHESELEARWKGGELDTEIDEEPHDD